MLGRVAEGQGQLDRAADLMKLAGERALRDASAQDWLVIHALRQRDLDGALLHLDAMFRTQDDALDQFMPVLVAIASSPQSAAPLVRLLGTNPPWRARFLNALPFRVANQAALVRFYAELQAGPNPPSPQELQPYLDRLVNDGSFKQAYATWVETLPPARRADSRTLYNASFQYPSSGSEFDWKILQARGASVEIANDTGAEGSTRILRLEFSGARVDFHNVSHLLVLPPGTYQFAGEVKAEGLVTERGLWWRVSCVKHPAPSLGQTELVSDSTTWRPFALTFTVPPQGCQAQILQLELPARVALEQKIAGVVTYRNLAVMARRGDAETGQSGRP